MLRELMRSRLHGESNLRIDRRQSRFRLLGLPTKQRKKLTQTIKGRV